MARATRSSLNAQRSSMRAAAAADDHHVERRAAVRGRASACARSRRGASSPCTRTGAIRMRRSPKRRADDVQHVVDGGAGGRGHDADHARERGQRALAGGIEEALRLEPALELLEGELERAHALGLEQLDHQLVLAPRGVDVEAAEGQHLHAVLGLEAHPPARGRGRARARSWAVVVLQREVRVPGAGRAEVGDLALDPDRREPLLELCLDPRRQLGDGIRPPARSPPHPPEPPHPTLSPFGGEGPRPSPSPLWGEGRGEGRRQASSDDLEDPVDIPEDVIVPEAKDVIALRRRGRPSRLASTSALVACWPPSSSTIR